MENHPLPFAGSFLFRMSWTDLFKRFALWSRAKKLQKYLKSNTIHVSFIISFFLYPLLKKSPKHNLFFVTLPLNHNSLGSKLLFYTKQTSQTSMCLLFQQNLISKTETVFILTFSSLMSLFFYVDGGAGLKWIHVDLATLFNRLSLTTQVRCGTACTVWRFHFNNCAYNSQQRYSNLIMLPRVCKKCEIGYARYAVGPTEQ